MSKVIFKEATNADNETTFILSFMICVLCAVQVIISAYMSAKEAKEIRKMYEDLSRDFLKEREDKKEDHLGI